MSIVVPFKALRPQKQHVRAVASLPYDVISREEARQMAAGNPLSFLHVEKSDIDLPPDVSPHDPSIYETARKNLDRFIEEGVLFQEREACFYVYAQEMKGFSQYGIAAGISVAEYEEGKIKKHELTRADKEFDRICHVDAVNAHTGPVFATYRARPAIDGLVEKVVMTLPEYDFVADDGVRNRVWVIGDETAIGEIIGEFAALERLYIADGHHRAAAAAAVARMRREQRPGAGAEYEHILAVLFPHRQVTILDYNRLVKDLNGKDAGSFLEDCRCNFIITEDYVEKKPSRAHEFGMYLAGRWYKLTARAESYDEKNPVGRLDVSILQNLLFRPLLDIHDARTNSRIEFVGGVRGMKELEERVDSGEFSLAFALYPVTIEQLMEVADADMIMPPKSTWFEPKLRSGIFTHLLD